MTKDQIEYRRLTHSIVAECGSNHTMPTHIAVGLILTHVENMMKDDPTTSRLREFLIEVASVLLMVDGFFDVIEKPSEVGLFRDYKMAGKVKQSMADFMDRMKEVEEMLTGVEAEVAKRTGKMN